MSEPTYSTSEAREAQLLHAAEAAALLNDSERPGFRVRKLDLSLIRLACPAASLNAAAFLRRNGIDAHAARTNGGWVVKVWS